MILNNKIIFIFNKFFISFIKDVKESSEELKVTIKKDYKIIDKSSTEYIDEFWNEWKGLLEGDLTQNKVLKEFTVKDILEKIQTVKINLTCYSNFNITKRSQCEVKNHDTILKI